MGAGARSGWASWGGQLGRMLGLAGIPLGLRFRFLDPGGTGPPAAAVGPVVEGLRRPRGAGALRPGPRRGHLGVRERSGGGGPEARPGSRSPRPGGPRGGAGPVGREGDLPAPGDPDGPTLRWEAARSWRPRWPGSGSPRSSRPGASGTTGRGRRDPGPRRPGCRPGRPWGAPPRPRGVRDVPPGTLPPDGPGSMGRPGLLAPGRERAPGRDPPDQPGPRRRGLQELQAEAVTGRRSSTTWGTWGSSPSSSSRPRRGSWRTRWRPGSTTPGTGPRTGRAPRSSRTTCGPASASPWGTGLRSAAAGMVNFIGGVPARAEALGGDARGHPGPPPLRQGSAEGAEGGAPEPLGERAGGVRAGARGGDAPGGGVRGGVGGSAQAATQTSQSP
jgi:hypothetical protein